MRLTLRKYMFVYGGFSIYCENACEDLWTYEIPYAPYRYYPSNETLHRGNVWKEIYPTDEVNPGKRIHHSMVADKNFKYIYLYGGLTIDKEGKYKVSEDLYRYDIFLNLWSKMHSMGVSEITRTVIVFFICVYFFIYLFHL